jgi:hypothetical protein
MTGGSLFWGGHNASGPVTVSFGTRPTFTNCSNPSAGTITTSGTWTLSVQEYGLTTPVLTAPAQGIDFLSGTPPFTQHCTSGAALSFTGTSAWFNGFTSPVNQPSVGFLGASPSNLFDQGCWNHPGSITISLSAPGLVNFTDTTQPTAAPVVGP